MVLSPREAETTVTQSKRRTVIQLQPASASARSDESAARGADLHHMREANRMLVLNCVREHGAIARAAVARQTGLSRTTIGNIMDDLLREGLVRESESLREVTSRGRRVIPVHFNASAGFVIGVAMGRNHVTLLLADLAANVIKRADAPFATARGPQVCLSELATDLRAFAAEQRVAWSKVIGVGVGIPGPVDLAQQRSASPPRMPGWDGTNVSGVLSEALKKPVYLDNNCNMGALGESRYGAGHDVGSLLYVKVGTGIGSGLVVGGQIYRGHSGSAGELGHMTVDPSGPLCDCGNRGCLEASAGGPAILAEVRAAGRDVSDMAQVIEAANQGDLVCAAALRRAGDRLGVVLAGLVNFFNPAWIVLDGSTMRAGDLALDAVRASVAARSLRAPLAQTQVTSAALSGSAIALGGVATVLDATFSNTSPLRLARM
jgi:predicted NBD/HSP70 family sugar kinase